MQSEKPISRRDLLRVVGAIAVTGIGVSSISGRSRATHSTRTPAFVDDPTFESDLLESYKPALITRDLDVMPTGIHGFVVRSEESDLTALTYWAEYPVQIRKSGHPAWVSHIGDHEPFYVFLQYEGTVDEQIDEVVYTGYHWLKATSTDPPTTTDDRPIAYVFPDYHHYGISKAETTDYAADDSIELKDLTSSLPNWLDDPDFHDSLAEKNGGPAYNPWLMFSRDTWLRNESLTDWEKFVREIWLLVGIRGAKGSDLA